ncbi:MAG: hypothetical protein P4L56_11290 [Candidatus Sulfopaludibacter sp.]|nr:hypothetical protein [Candidatus Sulfopaludibacter sp.]
MKTDANIPDDCKECIHWDQVEQRVRVRSVLTSMVDKLEEKVIAGDFKPTVADFLRTLEADQNLEGVNEGPTEYIVRWEDLSPTSQN